MIKASPSHITLATWVRVRVRVTGDAHISWVLGMGMPKTQGWSYHCNSDRGDRDSPHTPLFHREFPWHAGTWCKYATCTKRSVTNASFKQWVGIVLMPKIDGVHKNHPTPELWDETHLRETFYDTLIFQQSSMICIGRHVGGHTLAPQHGGQNYFLLVSC